jgi:hypothetical protein
LIEADFSKCVLMLFTKPVVHNMDKTDIIPETQLAQKGQQCTVGFLWKELMCSYSLINHMIVAWMEVDAD